MIRLLVSEVEHGRFCNIRGQIVISFRGNSESIKLPDCIHLYENCNVIMG
jgi:hypothetical protein